MTKPPLPIVRTRADLQSQIREWRRGGLTIGFVPTMGALHAGHLSLVTRALEAADRVVASIYVNPAQFAPGEDFEDYPRTEAADITKLEAAGCHLVYCPTTDEMYPDGSVTNVRVEEMSDLLDGIYRPHFFYGVTTVVARLFLHVTPDVAVFGEKDYQQLQIIKRMVRDLGFTIDIIGGETGRDEDGLALSSRNAYLSETERPHANGMIAALRHAAALIEDGKPVSIALEEADAIITAARFDKLDYVSAVDPLTLQALSDGPVKPGYEGRLLAAAWKGKTRLIDNIGFKRPA